MLDPALGAARQGRGEHHMPTRALLKQPRQEQLDRMDRGPQVDVDHPTPVVVRHLHDRTVDNDAGVAEYDIICGRAIEEASSAGE